MKNVKQRNNLLILVIITIFVLASLLGWLIFETDRMAQENVSLKNNLKELIDKKSKLSVSRKEVGRLEASLDVLNEYFVVADQKVAMINSLEVLASKAGIEFILNNAIDGDRISLDANIKGSFQNIYYFISLLETNNYWVSFDKISLSRSADGKSGIWSGSIIINIPQTQ